MPWQDCNEETEDATTTNPTLGEAVTTSTVASVTTTTTSAATTTTTIRGATTTTAAATTTRGATPAPISDPTLFPSTALPTKSPIYNRFFCAQTYALAESECFTNEPCGPGGAGCSNPEEQCYGISLERCLSPAPTGTPTGPGPRPTRSPTVSPVPTVTATISHMPTDSPTDSPSKSPVVNTQFCGATYSEAETGCSEQTACPSGGCPGGQMCFTGIVCPATAPAPTPVSPGATADPTPGQPSGGTIFSPTSSPMTWWENIGIGGPASPTVPAPPTLPPVAPQTNERYCGLSAADAAESCAFRTPCPNGMSGVCDLGQTCFNIPVPCGTVGGGDGATTTPPPLPTVEYDITSPNFCGTDYNDAAAFCYERVPCPSGFNDVCPFGQECFPVSRCESPPPTTSPAPTLVGGPDATGSPTVKPTRKPTTPAPTWPQLLVPDGGRSGAFSTTGSAMLLRSLALGGVLFVALIQ